MDSQRVTAILNAIKAAFSPETINDMLGEVQDINYGNGTNRNLLMFVIDNENDVYTQELVMKLLERGADPNSTNSTGHTPLMMAASVGDVEICKKLLEMGADVNSVSFNGDTALQFAEGFMMNYSEGSILEVIQEAVTASKPVNTENEELKMEKEMLQQRLKELQEENARLVAQLERIRGVILKGKADDDVHIEVDN